MLPGLLRGLLLLSGVTAVLGVSEVTVASWVKMKTYIENSASKVVVINVPGNLTNCSGTISIPAGYDVTVNAAGLPTDGPLWSMLWVGADASGSGLFFSVAGNLTLRNLELRGSGYRFNNPFASTDKGGAIFVATTGRLDVQEGGFKNCLSYYGGAIYNLGFTSLFATYFTGNSAKRGGAIMNYNLLDVKRCKFTGNNASDGHGGAIANFDSDGVLRVSNSLFAFNAATKKGGDIMMLGIVYITDTVFHKSRVDDAGTGGGAISSNAGSLYLSNVSFTGQSAPDGGAIYLEISSSLFVNNSRISNTEAVDGAAIYSDASAMEFMKLRVEGTNASEFGVIYLTYESYLMATELTCDGNYAHYRGNCIFAKESSNLRLHNSDIKNGNSHRYGALSISGGSTVISNCMLVGNGLGDGVVSTGKLGGAISCSGTHLNISDSSFVRNFGAYNGGAIYISNSADTHIEIRGTNASGNLASSSGGFLYMAGGALKSFNLSVSGNIADEDGGGMYLSDTEHVEVWNSRFTNNMARTSRGGAIYSYNSDDSFINIYHTFFISNNASSRGGALSGYFPIYHIYSSNFLDNVVTDADLIRFSASQVYADFELVARFCKFNTTKERSPRASMVVTTYGVFDDCDFKANQGYAIQMDNAGGKYKPLLSRNTYFHGLNVTSPNGQVMCGDSFETYLGTEYDPVCPSDAICKNRENISTLTCYCPAGSANSDAVANSFCLTHNSPAPTTFTSAPSPLPTPKLPTSTRTPSPTIQNLTLDAFDMVIPASDITGLVALPDMIGYLAIALISLTGISALTSLILKYPVVRLPKDEAVLLVESFAACFPLQLCFHLVCCVKRSDFVQVILIGADGKEIKQGRASEEAVTSEMIQAESKFSPTLGEEKMPDVMPPVLRDDSANPLNNEGANKVDAAKPPTLASSSPEPAGPSIEMSKATIRGTVGDGEKKKKKKKKKTLKGAADIVKVGASEEVKKKRKKKDH